MSWWGKPKDPKPEEKKNEATQIKDAIVEKLPSKEELREKSQQINQTDKNGNVFDDIAEGYGPDSTDSNVRYAAYATRIRTILLSAHRYVAYTSDIGESFRPVAHPNLVRGAYGVSWLYLIGDVSYEGYKSYWHNQRVLNPSVQLTPRQEKVTGLPATETRALQPGTVAPLDDYRTVMVQRAIFQSLASMGLPAFTIHSVVRYSGRAMKDMKNKAIRTWAPIGLGLAIVPFLPAMFDEPVENAVEWAFHKGFETFGGKSAVGNAPTMGREDLLTKKPKEKEL
ncbi:mitochondrial 18 KDa protein-domain-containing protein [Fusarium tricinctum]|jgi:fission process protein 1|uniref:Mitochondrial fission process protein 1 n=2 Tax=Fusarium tricinctum species complex TaxID=679429 RepID=A0A8K0RMS8_9HYPO|nr:mitochondrial 18 KDa protein-domain-containing protein [Fusarium tricinctum]